MSCLPCLCRLRMSMQRSLLLLSMMLACLSVDAVVPGSKTFPQFEFSRPPDGTGSGFGAASKIAAALKRSCARHDTLVWNSANPLDELQSLAAEMNDQNTLLDKREITKYPGRVAGGRQRLYLAISRTGDTPFTWLWSAGNGNVSLEICAGPEPDPATGNDAEWFSRCVDPAPGTVAPMTDCSGIRDR